MGRGIKKAAAGVLPLIAVAGVVGGVVFAANRSLEGGTSSTNFSVHVDPPAGWDVLPAEMTQEYVFENPENGVQIRVSDQQVVSNEYGEDGLTARQLAEDSIYNTTNKMAGWYARPAGQVIADGETMELVERGHDERTVVTAFMVKGNSTFIVALVGGGEAKEAAEETMPFFKEWLEDVRIRPIRYASL